MADLDEVNKIKKILKEKIMSIKEIPDDIKFNEVMDFDTDPKNTEHTEAQKKVIAKLKSGYYKDRPKELQKDLESIDRNLQWCDFERVDLSGLNLHGVDFTPPRFQGTNLSGCNLTRAKLTFGDAHNADFSNTNLERTKLSMIKATNAKFIGCNAIGANFSMSDVSNANFTTANLTTANFRASRIVRANFASANLTGADLSVSDLNDSDFSTAMVSGASVEGSTVTGTIFDKYQDDLIRQGVKYGDDSGTNKGGYGREHSVGGYIGGSASIYNAKTARYTKKGRYVEGD